MEMLSLWTLNLSRARRYQVCCYSFQPLLNDSIFSSVMNLFHPLLRICLPSSLHRHKSLFRSPPGDFCILSTHTIRLPLRHPSKMNPVGNHHPPSLVTPLD